MADKNVTRFRSLRRKPLPMPAVVTKIYQSGFASAPSSFSEVTFSLRQSKAGPLIYLHADNQQWCINSVISRQPKNYEDARLLVKQLAATHGHPPFAERVKPRQKRPKGEASALFKRGECKEEWLSSDIPALWAEAMVRCQHPAGYCGRDGYCHYGDCNMQMRDATP